MKADSSPIASHRRPPWRLRPLALSLACIGLAPAAAQILPSGAVVRAGNVVVGAASQLGNGGVSMGIDQTSHRAVVNWTSFSIGALDQVNISQPGVSSVLLNRVTGAQASSIAGKLTANGHVYLVNPAGVTFSNTSRVSVGGLVASTLDIAGPDDQDLRNLSFMAGGVVNPETGRRELGFAGAADSKARIMVAPGAQITTTSPGGTVGLFGGLVRNEGQINVAQGSVGLVSASKVSIDVDGDGLTRFIVPLDGMTTLKLSDVQANPDKLSLDATTTAQVMNSGTLTADGGRIAMVGSSTLAQQVVNHSGTARALSMTERGGEIVLQGRHGSGSSADNQVVVTGVLNADAGTAGVAGGSVRTSADDLRIRSTASITASGGAGAANGTWTAEGRRKLEVGAEDPVAGASGFITASVVGNALSRNTHVTLSTTDEADVTSGLVFGENAKVLKTGGGNATLRVNSLSNIDMRNGSEIRSSAGALNVEFNADSQGIAAAATPGNGTAAAAIRIDGATIDANGGDIRFFGQGVASGRAMGGQVKGLDADLPNEVRSGIWIGDSKLSTQGAGQISLRGQGVTQGTAQSYGVVVTSESESAGLRASGGSIRIDAGASDVRLDAGVADRALLDVSSATGAGGSIGVDARNVLATNNGNDGTTLLADARGAGRGGSVTLRANAENGVAGSGILAMDPNLRIDASAITPVGDGGEVRLLGERSLYAYGSVAARGGSAGGNGGFIETSGGFAIPETVTVNQDGFIGGGIRLNGFRVDASAAAGKAGTWLIDPVDVDIVNGAAAGSLPANPFVPTVGSVIQDGDINAALNGGTSVRITTGALASGVANEGDIHLRAAGFVDPSNPSGTPSAGPARIDYTANKGPVTFQLDAHRSVRADTGTVIASSGAGGPLNVVLNAGANGADSIAVGGGQVSFSGSIYTNGGKVDMTGNWSAAGGKDCSVCLDGPVIDTRAGNTQTGVTTFSGGSEGLAGGAVQLTGRTTSPVNNGSASFPAVLINGTRISTSTGDVTVVGTSTNQSGVLLSGFQSGAGIFTTSGKVSITGIGNFVPSGANLPGHGVVINGATVRTVDGDVAIRGLRQASGTAYGAGVQLGNGAVITTLGTGNIDIAGQSAGNGAGIYMAPDVSSTAFFPGARINGNNNVVLRASNDNSTDALVIDGTVRAGNVLNLRPGGVDAAGNAVDVVANPITLGGASVAGFSVSADEFTRITAGTVVAGSNAHAGDINLAGPLAFGVPLTLQNQGGGGNINLNGTLATPRLALLAGGNVNQAAGATIAAGALLARANTGNVTLTDAGNNVGTVVGTAAGSFRYVDADALTIGPVTATTFDAASNSPQTDSATSMAATNVFVRNLLGDMSLAANVSSTAGADLVTAARFQNVGGNSLGGAAWRVWADTWVGETRGGIAGSPPLPNFYNCAYGGFCGVTVTPGNHFIYRQQPDAAVVIGNQTRPFGLPNLPFTYTLAGLILGDTGAGFSGALSSPGTASSLPGRYAINGSFTSAEGYRVTVVPGELFVTAAINRPLPDVLREMPSTWLYDRNIGQAPICLATGPLDGDRASQGGDVLAREWSRVRSRPNLLNCVDTEKRNGCADF